MWLLTTLLMGMSTSAAAMTATMPKTNSMGYPPNDAMMHAGDRRAHGLRDVRGHVQDAEVLARRGTSPGSTSVMRAVSQAM